MRRLILNIVGLLLCSSAAGQMITLDKVKLQWLTPEELAITTLEDGELIRIEEGNLLYIGDGVTQGGLQVGLGSDIHSQLTNQLASIETQLLATVEGMLSQEVTSLNQDIQSIVDNSHDSQVSFFIDNVFDDALDRAETLVYSEDINQRPAFVGSNGSTTTLEFANDNQWMLVGDGIFLCNESQSLLPPVNGWMLLSGDPSNIVMKFDVSDTVAMHGHASLLQDIFKSSQIDVIVNEEIIESSTQTVFEESRPAYGVHHAVGTGPQQPDERVNLRFSRGLSGSSSTGTAGTWVLCIDDISYTNRSKGYLPPMTRWLLNDGVTPAPFTLALTLSDAIGVVQDTPTLDEVLNAGGVSTNSVTIGAVGSTNVFLGSAAFGLEAVASGSCSQAHGYRVRASGNFSHAQGSYTTASGAGSHAQGFRTMATGSISHAQGSYTMASGYASHAQGLKTIASGEASHAAGAYAYAAHSNSYVWAGDASLSTTNLASSTTNNQYTVQAANGTRLLGGDVEIEGDIINTGLQELFSRTTALENNPNTDLIARLLTLEGFLNRLWVEEGTGKALTPSGSVMFYTPHDWLWKVNEIGAITPSGSVVNYGWIINSNGSITPVPFTAPTTRLWVLNAGGSLTPSGIPASGVTDWLWKVNEAGDVTPAGNVVNYGWIINTDGSITPIT